MAPWELEEQPVCWRDWALIAQSAEAEAETERHKIARAKQLTKTMPGARGATRRRTKGGIK